MSKPLIGYKMKSDEHEMFVVVEEEGDWTHRYWRCHNNGRDHDKEDE